MILSNTISAIILTYNEEIHLDRLLVKLSKVCNKLFIVDSGSTDQTLQIAAKYNAEVIYNKFENHPKQWHFALTTCKVTTPWVICLDADHFLSDELLQKLEHFSDENIDKDVNGIFLNRHNYFQGSRLKFGGYRNFYMLKLFRTGKVHSDLNENMDHRFIVEGKLIVWKDAVLNEENLKENDIDFWLQKHIKYSSLVAEEEWERRTGIRKQNVKRSLFGNPNEKKAYLKNIWWSMPLFMRPYLYYFYRFIILGGFLENRTGRTFHYLHAFWFRYLIDIKLYQIKKGKGL